MADPLSVAAGAKVTKALTEVVKDALDAPDGCRRMISQVEDIRNAYREAAEVVSFLVLVYEKDLLSFV